MKKMNNRTLFILFVILAALVAAMLIYNHKKGERSFRQELFEIDSAQVTALHIYPGGGPGAEIHLVREGEEWQVVDRGHRYPADTLTVRNILQTILSAKPERVAGLDRASWVSYQVTDSASTRVVVEEEGEVTADFRVGRISFSQPEQMQGYGRNRNPVIKSHVRVEGDERVYQVDGYLSMMFRGDPSSYRNKVISRFRDDQPVRFSFSYPGDSSFVLAKTGSTWLVENLAADSLHVVSYLRSVANTTGNEFAGEDEIRGLTFVYHLKIEGHDMPGVEIEGAKMDSEEVCFIRSSANPTAVFKCTNPALFNRIFVNREKFTK